MNSWPAGGGGGLNWICCFLAAMAPCAMAARHRASTRHAVIDARIVVGEELLQLNSN
jgi:hypothetical protein